MGKSNFFKNKYRTDTIRLKNYDYRSAGWYFVTICTKDRQSFFGEIRKGIMGLSDIGSVAQLIWKTIPEHQKNVELGEFVVMPNHVHGLIGLKNNPAETCRGVSLQDRDIERNTEFNAFSKSISGSLSVIINQYKGAVTRWCNQNNHSNFGWQPRFYEHIVRNKRSLDRIREYIYNNPIQWDKDDYYIQ